jgi:hypothetical protein
MKVRRDSSASRASDSFTLTVLIPSSLPLLFENLSCCRAGSSGGLLGDKRIHLWPFTNVLNHRLVLGCNKNGVRHHFLFFRCYQRYLARFLKITSFQVWITEAAMMRPDTPNNVLPTQMGMSDNNDTENMQMKTHRNASKRSFWPGVISTTLRDFLPTKLDASSQGASCRSSCSPTK